MANSFDPRKVLRQTSNSLLKQFFDGRGELQDVPWDELKEHEIEPVYAGWQALEHDRRIAVDVTLRELGELADEVGLTVLAEEIRWRRPEKLAEFAMVDGRTDKAMWVYLNEPAAFNEAALFARADGLACGRYWVRRNGLPAQELVVTDEVKQALGRELVKHYVDAQARGHHYHVEHYQRANGNEYFFAYLADYPDQRQAFDEQGMIRRHPERSAFENVFVYRPMDGTIELYAKGGKKVQEPLQHLFCKVVLGVDIGDCPSKPAYRLDHLKDRSFPFRTEPSDRITEVRIRRMRLEPLGGNRRIILEADPKGHRNDIYQMLDECLHHDNLPREHLHVTQVTFKITFMSDGKSRAKTLTFDISLPNSSNLKSQRDELQVVGERCLKLWGITGE